MTEIISIQGNTVKNQQISFVCDIIRNERPILGDLSHYIYYYVFIEFIVSIMLKLKRG